MIKRIDENTGREVRQLTDLPNGARLGYFRRQRHLPDGRILGLYCSDDAPPFYHTDFLVIDPESGDVEYLKHKCGHFLTIVNDGRAVFTSGDEKREVWAIALPDGEPELLGALPRDLPGHTQAPGIMHNITCDGGAILTVDTHFPEAVAPAPFRNEIDDVGAFWRHIYRPRSGDLYAYDLKTETVTKLVHLQKNSFQHIDPSPTDPTLLKFAQDGLGVFDQRIWAVRTDGAGLMKIRPQRKGEWVHHEFWWPGGQFVGYKYVDRRNDPTVHELPWGELAPRPLQLGIADLTGREVYLSEPLCCFQSHLHVSPKADMISGEGTLNNCFVYAAPFSWSEYNIDLQPYATIHTPYKLSEAQSVEAGFSTDSKWLLYNDTVEGKLQIHAVKV